MRRLFSPSSLWSYFKQALPALLAFTPALILAWLVARNASDVPVWDDWERSFLLEKYENGTLTFNDLYAPHIDHRILFPRLITLTLNGITGGDLRWEIGVVFLCGLAAAIGVARLARDTIFKGKTVWGVVFLSNLIILSPIAWDNWLWAVQTAFLLPMACTVWALVAVVQPWAWWKRLLVSLTLAIVGTHSFGHGFAVWPAVFCLALLLRDFHGTLKQRISFLSIWGAAGAAIIACYLLVDFTNVSHPSHSYGQGPGNAPPSVANYKTVGENLQHAGKFMLLLAGNGFSRVHMVDPQKLAPWIGAGWLTLFVLLGGWSLRNAWKKNPSWDVALPWLALGCAALLGMAAVTVGRLNVAGFSRAASIRYVSISQYLAVAVLFLLVLWWRQKSNPSLDNWKSRFGPVLAGCFAGFMIPAWNFGGQMMELCSQARLQGKAALVFLHHWEPQHMWRLDDNAEFVRESSALLSKLGYLRVPLAKTLDLSQFSPLHKDRSHGQALVEEFYKDSDQQFVATGYARLPDRPADGVLFTWELPGVEPRIFTMAEPTADMMNHPYPNDLELVGRIKPDKYAHCKWERPFELSQLGFSEYPQAEEVIVRTWLFDSKRLRAYRIRGAWKITRNGDFQVLDDPISPELRLHRKALAERLGFATE